MTRSGTVNWQSSRLTNVTPKIERAAALRAIVSGITNALMLLGELGGKKQSFVEFMNARLAAGEKC